MGWGALVSEPERGDLVMSEPGPGVQQASVNVLGSRGATNEPFIVMREFVL